MFIYVLAPGYTGDRSLVGSNDDFYHDDFNELDSRCQIQPTPDGDYLVLVQDRFARVGSGAEGDYSLQIRPFDPLIDEGVQPCHFAPF